MIQKLNLTLLVIALGNEPLLLGTSNSPQANKSFRAKIKSIKAQLISTTDQILKRNLRGRKKLELLTSLEEDAIPSTGSQNTQYLELKRIAQNIEKEFFAIRNGDKTHIRAYNLNTKLFRAKQTKILQTLNLIKTTPPVPRTPRTISNTPHE